MITICGAGIAGLTLAVALEQLNEDYLVLEKNSEVRTDGAGLVLHHNALCVLEALGVAKKMSGVQLKSFQLLMGNSKQVLPFSQQGTSRALAVHREQVMRVLLSKLPKGRIRCGVDVKSVQRAGETVIHTDGEKIFSDAAVVANGAASQLHGTPHITTSGQWCWRSVVPFTELESNGTEYWFGRHRLGVIPISHDHAYVFHVVQNADNCDSAAHLQWIQEQQAQGNFSNLDFNEALWLSHPLNERRITWGQGNCVAIGDAAHSMTPNMGQGAAMAMEDAWTLAQLIAGDNAPNTLAQRLASLRHKRVQAIQRQSKRMGQVAHLQNKALCHLRNVVFGLTPESLVVQQQRKKMLAFTDGMT